MPIDFKSKEKYNTEQWGYNFNNRVKIKVDGGVQYVWNRESFGKTPINYHIMVYIILFVGQVGCFAEDERMERTIEMKSMKILSMKVKPLSKTK